MDKIYMFSAPHKALRKLMSEFLIMAGQMTYSNQADLENLKAKGQTMFMLLSSHAATENEIILERLDAKIPIVSEHDRKEHEEIEIIQKKLEQGLSSLQHSSYGDYLRSFYLEFSDFYSFYMAHMYHEETETQKLIWENFSMEEQLLMRKAIIDKMDPETYIVWLCHMIPAQNEIENSFLLDALQKNMEPRNFSKLIGLLKSHMPAYTLSKLLKVVVSID